MKLFAYKYQVNFFNKRCTRDVTINALLLVETSDFCIGLGQKGVQAKSTAKICGREKTRQKRAAMVHLTFVVLAYTGLSRSMGKVLKKNNYPLYGIFNFSNYFSPSVFLVIFSTSCHVMVTLVRIVTWLCPDHSPATVPKNKIPFKSLSYMPFIFAACH